MSTYRKEEFINLLQSYIHKLNTDTLTPNEGLMLVEFFTKNYIQSDSYTDAKEDAISYAFLGYYLKELCKQNLSEDKSVLNETMPVD